jgi:hypothetical protein
MRRRWRQALGDQDRREREHRAQHVRSGLYEKCWDAGRKLLADNPGAQCLQPADECAGVLFDVIPHAEQQGVLKQVMDIDPGPRRAGF